MGLMTSDIDIYRVTRQLIKTHGDGAEDYTLKRMNAFMQDENIVAASTWLMLAQAIKELGALKPENNTVH